MRHATAIFLTLLALGSAHCTSTHDASVTGEDDYTQTPARDWDAHPAIVEIDEADEIFAVSDPHGEYAIFAQLLQANHLVGADLAWTGGKATLVVCGDLIDKGPASLRVIDLVRSLQKSAPASGGRVVVTMGNHEAEFLADPKNDKATSTGEDRNGVDNELEALHIDPTSLVRGTDPQGRGAWIANLPLGVRVKKWFFSHAGNTDKKSVADLGKDLRHALDKGGFRDDAITGKDSILEAERWYGDPDDKDAAKKEADALGVDHIVFGHDPGAFGDHGSIAMSKNGILVKIDTAMGIHDEGGGVSNGAILHITTRGKDTAEILDHEGHKKSLL